MLCICGKWGITGVGPVIPHFHTARSVVPPKIKNYPVNFLLDGIFYFFMLDRIYCSNIILFTVAGFINGRRK
jgi:hypothetical protein